jgi:hypothetical protein
VEKLLVIVQFTLISAGVVQVVKALQICRRQDGSNHDEEQRDAQRRDAPGTSPGLAAGCGRDFGQPLLLMALLLLVLVSGSAAWEGVA